MTDAKRKTFGDDAPGAPELFTGKTPEERAAEAKRTAAEIARMRAGNEAGSLERRVLPDDGATWEETAERVARLVLEGQAARDALPCSVAMTASALGEGDRLDVIGRNACEDAEEWRTCGYAVGDAGTFCPRRRLQIACDEYAIRLVAAGVDVAERAKIIDAVRSRAAAALLETDPLAVVRGVLRRQMLRVNVKNAAQVAKDGEVQVGAVDLKGTERLVCLLGNPGVGKSLASIYALARAGGRYVRSYDLAEQGRADRRELVEVSTLVIDQIGRAPVDSRRLEPAAVEEIVEKRTAGNRMTLLVGPVRWRGEDGAPGFCDRYPDAVDRVRGFGVVVEFGGESLR